jgi:hypothetical protein
MKFWAIAYRYQEEVFYNFEIEEDTLDLTEQCFLPTESLATEIIEEKLSADYAPVGIELETLNKNGIWSWSRDQVEEWDEEY